MGHNGTSSFEDMLSTTESESGMDDYYDDEGEETDSDKRIILGFQILFACLGLIGNISMLALMQRKIFFGKSFAVYFSFAAVFDTFCVLLNAILDASEVLHGTWLMGLAAKSGNCEIFHIVDSFVNAASPWFMVVLTLDRFLMIKFPGTRIGRLFAKAKVAIIVSVGVIVFALAITAPWGAVTNAIAEEEEGEIFHDCLMHEHIEKKALIFWLVMVRVVPLLVVSVLNVCIVIFLLRNKGDADKLENDNVRRVNVIIAYVLVMTVVTWLPLTVVELTEAGLLWRDAMTEEIHVKLDKAIHACLVIYLITFVQNFYIFFLTSAKYRKEYIRMITCNRCCKEKNTDKSKDNSLSLTETITKM